MTKEENGSPFDVEMDRLFTEFTHDIKTIPESADTEIRGISKAQFKRIVQYKMNEAYQYGLQAAAGPADLMV
jgi:hypothetical protein